MPPRPRISLRSSVRGRLILLLAAVTAPALLLAAVLVLQAYRNERDAVVQNLSATARAVSFLVDRHLAEYEALLKGLASTRALEDGDFATFHQRASGVTERDRRWIVLVDVEGKQKVNTRVPFGTPLPNSDFESDVRPTLATGRTYISNLVIGTVAKTNVIYVAVPVTIAREGPHALALVMTPAAFAETLHLEQIAPDNIVSVADRSGTIVARNRNPDRFVGGKATPDMVAAIAQADAGIRSSVTLEGIPVATAFNRAPESRWSTLIGAPTAELYASARGLLWTGLSLSALLLLVAGVIAVWIIRGLAHGVESLAAGSAALARESGTTLKRSGLFETDFVAEAMEQTARQLRQTTDQLESALAQEHLARTEAEALSETARALTTELDMEGTVQKATDAATKLTGAKFGAFFYNVVNDRQESYVLYALSGAPREAFEKFGLPRNTDVFAPTFKGEGVVRVDDITQDPRYGKNAPHHGMPKGHLPVRSYLAVPVMSRNGEVLGGMFFGHPEPKVFTERAERIAVGIAAQAAIAVDNAKLYRSAKAAADRLSFSLAALDLGEWDWDATTDRMRISRRTAAIYGLPPDLVATREEMRTALHPDDRDRSRAVAQEAAEKRKDYVIEYRVRHPQLGLRWVAATGRPAYGPGGKLTGMMGVVQDVTDRKNAEMVLRTQNEVLEQRVAERTLKLRETIGELEAFSYSVSHDMRAPLRSMQGYAELLLSEHAAGLDETGRRYLARITSNAERLDLLVRDVLTYSKVAKEEIDLKAIDLDRFVPALVQQMPEYQKPGVTIEVQHPLPAVRGHEAYLSQIFTNLVGNAVKFVATGVAPKVDISARAEEKHVRVCIHDNGIGIASEHFDRIFQIFGRVHADKEFEGTGIGLAIVKKAVQRMGGDIGVESTPGRGTTFWFTLAKA